MCEKADKVQRAEGEVLAAVPGVKGVVGEFLGGGGVGSGKKGRVRAREIGMMEKIVVKVGGKVGAGSLRVPLPSLHGPP